MYTVWTIVMTDKATVIKQKVLYLEPRKSIVDEDYCYTDNGKLFLETERVKKEKNVGDKERDCFDQLLECWWPIYFMLTKYIVMQQEKLIENIIFKLNIFDWDCIESVDCFGVVYSLSLHWFFRFMNMVYFSIY